MADTKQTAEDKAALKAAEAEKATVPDEELRRLAATTPPLVRDEEHSFVPVEDTDLETDPALITPVGENIDAAVRGTVGEPATVKVTRPDPAESSYERSAAVTETDLEGMSDEQIKASGLLKKGVALPNPARIAGSSEQPRHPTHGVPAAGAGSWPLNESQMPAVMPTDPPVEDADARSFDSDNGFAKAAGFTSKDGTLIRKAVTIEKNEVAQAAALYARLRQQFPAFTKEQLADEFETQWLSIRTGAEQSHRAAELSPQGLTAVGDHRIEQPGLGELRAKAPEADPAQPTPAATADAGLPSQNEPASVAVDAAKEPSGETAKADEEAAKQYAKFDRDGDGRPGGAPKGGNKKA